MIKLELINEKNWLNAIRLSVTETQSDFLDRPIGILARGYVYREHNARVYGIFADAAMIGLALVKNLDEEPACYDLQQFMIDRRFQNRGCGTEALRQLLALLRVEGKYGCVEVCVNKNASQALHVYEKVGFSDTGYIDPDVPQYMNLMYYFNTEYPMHPIKIRIAKTAEEIAEFRRQLDAHFTRDIFPEGGQDLDKFRARQYHDDIERLHTREINPLYFLFFEQNGKNIGFAMPVIYTTEDGKCFILEFAVYPEFRGHGTGTACANALFDWAAARGALFYELNADREDRRRFWARLGFLPNGEDEWGLPLMLRPSKSGRSS